MDKKKGINFFMVIIAIVTGSKLYQHIDFKNMKMEKPALDIIYLVAFLMSVIVLIKDFTRKPDQ